MTVFRFAAWIAFTSSIAASAWAQPSTQPAFPKPILDGYTADPHATVFGDTYYVYPTSDKDQWLTTDFSAWSSKDLINWKKEGMILDVANGLSWAKIRAWAPAAIEHKGKYYFYYAAEQKIGVAMADKPTGPFVDPLKAPLIPQDRQRWPGQVIDVFAYIDDDGSRYLYWGQGQLYVRKLNDDMISFADETATRLTPPQRADGRYNEGVWVLKRKGTYYFMWSEDDARSPNYRVAYGTAPSPMGPITVATNPVILKKSGPVIGTGHHSVINVPGTDRWYIVYHRHAIPNGNGYTRETCIARMEFNEDGTIKEADPMAVVFPPGSAGEPIQKK